MPKWLLVLNGVLVSLLLLSVLLILWLGVWEFQKKEPELLSFLQDTHSRVNETFDNLNRPCGTSKPCGTLADVNQTLHTVRGTFGQVEYSLRVFNKHQDSLYNQENALFLHSDKVLTDLDGTVTKVDTTLSNVDPLLTSLTTSGDALTTELSELHHTNYTLNDYLTSTPFKDFLTDTYGITHNIDSVSSDIADKTHEFLYPSPCKGKLCTLKKIYTITREVGPLMQPFYYGVATYENIRNSQP